MKKKYKNLVPVALVILMALAWYQLNSNAMAKQNEYDKYIEEAQRYENLGILTYAQKNYMDALKIKDTIEIRFKVADCIKGNDEREYLKYCQKILEKYPYNVEIYNRLAEYYQQKKDFKSCFEIIDIAKKRKLSSETLTGIEKAIAFEYSFAYNTYDDVTAFIDGYCVVKRKDYYGFVDTSGKLVIDCIYKKVSSFCDGFAAVVDQTDMSYFIDTEGNKAIATHKDSEYTEFGMISDGMMTAMLNGKYVYLDKSFNKLFGDYDFASAVNNVAAVRIGDSWEIIDKNGQALGGKKYLDVIIDENGYACRKNRIFAKDNEGYRMLDTEGNMVSNQVFDDARPFSFGTLAAVKINDKWGFVDQSGNMVIEPKFDDARSFSYGLAAVKITGKWGFIDTTGEIMIEPEFYDARDFTKEGTCFVKEGEKWQLLKLYRNLSSEG
ncbi:WG repeat-containing protein [Acetivibrio clariflavus]|nr:WG repeat-containing protein [Acetivibrio clariflavus]